MVLDFTNLINVDPAQWTGYQIWKFDDCVNAKFSQAFLLLMIVGPPLWYKWRIMLAILDSN